MISITKVYERRKPQVEAKQGIGSQKIVFLLSVVK